VPILRHIRIALVALCALAPLAPTASALTFPPLTGRVVDDAGILDQATRARLTARLAAVETQTAHQVVVATVSSLQEQSIETYATGLLRAWRLGRKGENDGVLLLVAPSQREARIAVGHGLEATLTDAVTRLIVGRSIVPRFRADDFAGGIVQATDDVVQVLTGQAEQRRRHMATPAPQYRLVVAPTGGIMPPVLGETLAIGGLLLMFVVIVGLFGYLFLVGLAAFLAWLGVLPRPKDCQGSGASGSW
jgi:uncharacterized protein